jgi:hypothetical protein
MLYDIVQNRSFQKLMHEHIHATLKFFLSHEQNFGILCTLEHISFEPPLPESIGRNFQPLTLFFLAGYTYESAILDDTFISFEAGFGNENFGSVVTVPLLAITQIIVDDTPILVNQAQMTKFGFKEASIDESGVKNSMEALMANPENQKLFKK